MNGVARASVSAVFLNTVNEANELTNPIHPGKESKDLV